MPGDPSNGAPGTFCTADVDVAARRLAYTLSSEGADTLVIYDSHGGTRHPCVPMA
jgi:hypothetical protein